jgi:hypothetical protein
MVDKRHLKCIKCSTRATYKFKNQKNAIYCSTHKEKNMICIRKKICRKKKNMNEDMIEDLNYDFNKDMNQDMNDDFNDKIENSELQNDELQNEQLENNEKYIDFNSDDYYLKINPPSLHNLSLHYSKAECLMENKTENSLNIFGFNDIYIDNDNYNDSDNDNYNNSDNDSYNENNDFNFDLV